MIGILILFLTFLAFTLLILFVEISVTSTLIYDHPEDFEYWMKECRKNVKAILTWPYTLCRYIWSGFANFFRVVKALITGPQ